MHSCWLHGYVICRQVTMHHSHLTEMSFLWVVSYYGQIWYCHTMPRMRHWDGAQRIIARFRKPGAKIMKFLLLLLFFYIRRHDFNSSFFSIYFKFGQCRTKVVRHAVVAVPLLVSLYDITFGIRYTFNVYQSVNLMFYGVVAAVQIFSYAPQSSKGTIQQTRED